MHFDRHIFIDNFYRNAIHENLKSLQKYQVKRKFHDAVMQEKNVHTWNIFRNI